MTPPDTMVGRLAAGQDNRYWSIKARPRFRTRVFWLASKLGVVAFVLLWPVIAGAAWLTGRLARGWRGDIPAPAPETPQAIARTSIEPFLAVYPTAVYSPLVKALELGFFSRYTVAEPSLEIGIGDGVFAAALGTRGGHRVSLGTDLIFETLASARVRGVHDAVFVSDAQEIPLPPGSVRTVLMNNLMHHVPSRERVVLEVFNVLQPGGLLLFTDNMVGWNDFMWDRRLLRRLLPATWLRRYDERKLWLFAQSLITTPDYWTDLARRNGWDVVEISPFVSRTGMTVSSVFEFLNLKFGQPTRAPLRWLLGSGARRRSIEERIRGVVDDLIVADAHLSREEGAAFLFVALRKPGEPPDQAPRPVFACPVCKTALSDPPLRCASCGRGYHIVDGIPVLLSYAERLPWLRDYLAYQERRAPREYVT